MTDINDGYDQPHEITGAQMVFPAGVVGKYMPDYADIPEDFKTHHNVWAKFASDWFFKGWPQDRDLIKREGVDPQKAHDHLRMVLGSFEPKHEHKEAAVAWLLSRWFEKIVPHEQ